MKENIGTILFTEKQIQERAKEIAAKINKDFAGEEVVLLGTLKGSFMWFADIAKNIDLDVKVDFISISSYGNSTKSSGEFELKYEPSTKVYDKNIIVVEDIVDSGKTLEYIYKYFENMNPKTLKICTMLDKPSRREVDVAVDYIGFEVENLFIVGYGLDFNQDYRTLPYITYLDK